MAMIKSVKRYKKKMEDLIDMIKSHILDIKKVSTKGSSFYQRSIMADPESWLVNNLINNNITRGDNK